MSEPTANDLVRRVGFTVRSASVIPMPIDPSLTNEGEAADAKATGEAIAAVLDREKVNDKTTTVSGNYKVVVLYASDIKVSDAEGAQTIAEALAASASSTASTIMYDTTNLVTIKDAIDGIKDEIDTELTEDEIDAIIDEVFGEDDE